MKKMFIQMLSLVFTLGLVSGPRGEARAMSHEGSEALTLESGLTLESSASERTQAFPRPSLSNSLTDAYDKTINVAANGQNAKVGTKDGARGGKDFTSAGKRKVRDENAANNGGLTKCEYCGTSTIPAKRSMKGVTPPKNETQIDHIIPKSKGGDGAPSNGQVLCRDCNRKKSNK